MNRRRFLAISACGLAYGSRASAATASWRGLALGTQASITLGGTGRRRAEETFAAIEAELNRLESIFSLYRDGSVLVRLNARGRLSNPPGDLVELLSLCGDLHRASGGAFDPSVQPLWLAHARGGDVDEAFQAVGWSDVLVENDKIEFARPGMSLTLNGVAQGYITDRIAVLLRESGYRDVLVDVGEIAALGTRKGEPWSAAVADPDGNVLKRLRMSDRCLAVSAPLGTLIDRVSDVGHIIDPRTGQSVATNRVVAVSADSAAVADGLSTACSLLSGAEAAAAVAQFPDAKIEIPI